MGQKWRLKLGDLKGGVDSLGSWAKVRAPTGLWPHTKGDEALPMFRYRRVDSTGQGHPGHCVVVTEKFLFIVGSHPCIILHVCRFRGSDSFARQRPIAGQSTLSKTSSVHSYFSFMYARIGGVRRAS